MNRFFKNTFTLFLCVLLLFGSVLPGTFSFTASAKTINEYAQGDLVNFGWYPQSEVTDSATINTLNGKSATWHSYEYYIGTGQYDGSMTPSGYMKYTDVTLGTGKYRGVQFSQYRPFNTGFISSANNSYQDENAYHQLNNTYWFKWEPLQWRVLNPSSGLVMCETIIDSQPFNNFVLQSGLDEYSKTAYWGDAGKTLYANNYSASFLRQWLTDDFYNTAFSASQQDIIVESTLDNSAYDPSRSAYNSASTTDKIYVLSFSDMMNTAYGFNDDNWTSDTARVAFGSDYAKCQGLYVDSSDGYSRWWLRSAGFYSDRACGVEYDGTICDYYYYNAGLTDFGVRPALKLNLTSEIIQPDVSEVGVDPLESIALKTNPTKTTYIVGETLDTSGLTLTATYKSSNSETISSGFICEPLVLATVGTQIITVTYKGKTTSFSVTVSDKVEHEHDYQPVVTAPKANAVGYTQYKCDCGEWKTDEAGKVVKDTFKAPTGKPSGLKCASRTATAQKFTWTKTAGVTGYQVQLLNSANKQVALNATTANAFTFSKLTAGTLYKARVRFFIKAADGKNYFGAWSALVSSPTLPAASAITKLTPAKKAFTAQWKKVAVTGYQLQYATNAKFTKATTKTIKGAAKVKLAIKTPKGGTRYYVRIRTYKTIGGKNYYSAWSRAKAVVTKK